ncbi:MAG: helix-turn-helix domain-containing protein [Candidatus Bathyarchaeota archaeon]|uniref:helix-turn-helix domain-containing protein n=1 Tax=Candidatus Bathycorpusculum sp. TaxID=2994959 RepID=UPI00283A7125|nr:helix-turn-helix domain-containing protein [Candidatus Termiticorpusculum sp.]MCL2258127.1 helix-turn-helix domain-containing protein [Candidatus Termiticorpusculum sp.]MCL2291596.1 helix-turn-helix domain-containing protein [Candidatus Termiticorpusculum sp.]
MNRQKYSIKLTEEQRKELKQFITSTSKKNTPQCKTHAKVLLCLDENGEKPLTPKQTATKCKLHRENIYKIRKQYTTHGLDRVLQRKKRETPPIPSKITGKVEAHIIATAASTAPEGKKVWTLQMIADKIVLDGVVENISDVSVMRVLKKHDISLI